MGNRNRTCLRRAGAAFALSLLLVFPGLPLSPAGAAGVGEGEGKVLVELSGLSYIAYHAATEVKGTDDLTKQPYKFRQERYGEDFYYAFSGLRRDRYTLEFSFFEPLYLPGERVFTVYADGNPLPGLTDLDICSRVGQKTAYQVTVKDVPVSGGRLELRFKASRKEATICNLRFLHGKETALEVNVTDSRHWQALPVRFVNGSGQDVHEVVLGRLGSRFMVNPVPQLLGWRQSLLGTWTDDLSELVLAFRDGEGDIRCLPFTDRYPVFSGLDQEMTMTGVSYVCRDPSLPFQATVTLRAPFYPGDARLSTAPFFYLEVEVSNPGSADASGEFLLARAHRDQNTGPQAPVALSGAPGYRFPCRYTYGDESRIRPDPNNSGYVEGEEAVAVDDAGGVEWHYDPVSSTDWVWGSPPGYPLPYPRQIYTFHPQGYSGFRWSFSLPRKAKQAKRVVLAAYTSSPVLDVRGDRSFRFLYSHPSGSGFASVEEVVGYALSEREAILEKTSFFDSLLSEEYLHPFPQAGRDLLAYALQSFLCNTWWCANDGGQDWFSVWEGTPCMYHSTLDVEYNDAWFYLCFWPDLLGKLLQAWPLFEKANAQGKYLSHDMGWRESVKGMAYEHDMPVEENTNYILLLYAYWKQTGDGELMRRLYPSAEEYARFVMACDTDGDGLPDLHTDNTIDQASPTVQSSRNQAYLGVKALASYQALMEMASSQGSPDQELVTSLRECIARINMALEERLWLDDHFKVCDDPSMPQPDREAYSIYASNGLLYLLASQLDCGLTGGNLERMRKDLVSSCRATRRRYGSVHSDLSNENQWVSQNLWRDALGYYLGAQDWAAGQEERTAGYWDLQRYFATKKNGGFWDVCVYADYYYLGTSEARALGFSDPQAARLYLQGSNRENPAARGAFTLDSAFLQSLGYYPRGTAAFSLVSALGRLRLDRPSGLLLYEAARTPARVPVLACADWEAPDPSSRVPVLVFGEKGDLREVRNRDLLPPRVASPTVKRLGDLKVMPFSCSPLEGSERKEALVSYRAPSGSLQGAMAFRGTELLRRIVPGEEGFAWDGKDQAGSPLTDGIYTLYLQARSPDPAVLTPSETVKAGVNTNLPYPSRTWYLAEGYTGSNPVSGEFDTWILVQNPNDRPAAVTMTFMLPGGDTVRRGYSLLPRSRFTVHVDDILPQAEVSTLVEADLPVIAERAVYFNGGSAGHCTVGVNAPSTSWYLAEGYTGGNFDEWVLIQNPGEEEAALRVEFQTQGQGTLSRTYRLSPHSRFTIHVDDLLPDAQVSTFLASDRPVVVERAQYLNDMRSGTCSLGARSPSYSWYFAEGYTDQGFEEWLCIQNPQRRTAGVEVVFMEPDGAVTRQAFAVPPRSRHTVPVHQVLPGVEVAVSVTSDLPVVAERAMYWKGRSDGHATLGSPCPEYSWYFAEGYTDQGFEEWLLLENPGPESARVEFTFMLPGGGNLTSTAEVGPLSRFTLNVADVVGATEVSVRVISDRPVVAERAMYFRGRSGGHCSVGAVE